MEKLTLRAIRVNCGLSLEEASIKIGISKDTLSNYERGNTYPDLMVLKRMETVYGISIFTDKVNFSPINDGLTDNDCKEG